MKPIAAACFLVLLVLALISANKNNAINTVRASIHKEVIACGVADNDFTAAADSKFIPLLPGWGHHQYRISTSSDSAQTYFNQGLSFYFSYHFREARASFKEAARFDANCAMAYWGLALAMGPYYNSYYYKMNKEVPGVLQQMQDHAGNSNEKEQALIQAMQQRYSTDTSNADRPQLDSAYAAALKTLTHRYPTDDDIKALYIDAVMLQHKWDFWTSSGAAKPWTMELVTTCQSILKSNPTHPAALHYYIHLTEASQQPQLALHSADVLKDAMPGVGHMVHMATHMYQRNGLYAKGVEVNEAANTVNNQVDDLAPNLGLGKNNVVHVYDVQSFCAINAGMYSKALPLYQRAKDRLLAVYGDIHTDAHAQHIYMLPVIAMVRTGRWNDILSSPAPDSNWKYAAVLDDFAKGLALVRTNQLKAASDRLQHLEMLMQDPTLAERVMPFNAPVQLCRIAAAILKGELLYAKGNRTAALQSLQAAVAAEDQLVYREPQEWLLPARQYLGACLIKMKRYALAEQAYQEDLVENPGNGWAQAGMYQCLKAMGKKKSALQYQQLYVKAFKDADVMPVGSVY